MLEISVHGSNNECDACRFSKTRLVDSCRVSTGRDLRPPSIPHTVTVPFCAALRYFCAGLYALHSTDVWAPQFLGGLWSSNFRMVSTLWNLLSCVAIEMFTYQTCSSRSKRFTGLLLDLYSTHVYILQVQTHSESRRVWYELLRGGYSLGLARTLFPRTRATYTSPCLYRRFMSTIVVPWSLLLDRCSNSS